MIKWLFEARQEKKLTQASVAQKSKISRQYYCFIENGSRRPSPQVAQRIAEVLDFPDKWYWLLE